MSSNVKNVTIAILALIVSIGIYRCYFSDLFLPKEITAYTANVNAKSSPLLTITRKDGAFVWSSNADARLKRYMIEVYDTAKQKPVKASLFVNQDGPGFIVIKHKSRWGGHHNGGEDDALLTPNVNEYKADENGDLILKSGSRNPFP